MSDVWLPERISWGNMVQLSTIQHEDMIWWMNCGELVGTPEKTKTCPSNLLQTMSDFQLYHDKIVLNQVAWLCLKIGVYIYIYIHIYIIYTHIYILYIIIIYIYYKYIYPHIWWFLSFSASVVPGFFGTSLPTNWTAEEVSLYDQLYAAVDDSSKPSEGEGGLDPTAFRQSEPWQSKINVKWC